MGPFSSVLGKSSAGCYLLCKYLLCSAEGCWSHGLLVTIINVSNYFHSVWCQFSRCNSYIMCTYRTCHSLSTVLLSGIYTLEIVSIGWKGSIRAMHNLSNRVSVMGMLDQLGVGIVRAQKAPTEISVHVQDSAWRGSYPSLWLSDTSHVKNFAWAAELHLYAPRNINLQTTINVLILQEWQPNGTGCLRMWFNFHP